MITTEVGFDGEWVAIEHDSSDIAAAIEFLFHDLPITTQQTVDTKPCAAHFHVRRGNHDEWQLTKDEQSLFKGKNVNGLANILMGEVLFHLIKDNNNGMAIHAGLVSGKNGSILMPAESGSGKSSLTTWLVVNGMQYHTDELVIIDPSDQSMKAFTRPLNIKVRGVDAIQSIFDIKSNEASIRSSEMVTMIPHRLVNPVHNPEIPPLAHILFPKFVADSESEITLLGGAEAGLELMRSNVIARNLPNHGFGQIAKLVRNVPAYLLRYRSYDDLPKLLDGII